MPKELVADVVWEEAADVAVVGELAGAKVPARAVDKAEEIDSEC